MRFDNVSYRALFSVFVVSTVVFVATFVAADEGTHSSAVRRLALAAPLAYVVLDALFLDESGAVSRALGLAVVATLVHALWVAARV